VKFVERPRWLPAYESFAIKRDVRLQTCKERLQSLKLECFQLGARQALFV
jgi:hypothetical protein